MLYFVPDLLLHQYVPLKPLNQTTNADLLSVLMLIHNFTWTATTGYSLKPSYKLHVSIKLMWNMRISKNFLPSTKHWLSSVMFLRTQHSASHVPNSLLTFWVAVSTWGVLDSSSQKLILPIILTPHECHICPAVSGKMVVCIIWSVSVYFLI